jgi:hypothetical protein
VARYDSYAQLGKDGKPMRMWATMPDVMVAKCSEALALRRAFPQDLSGLYTADEMSQAETAPERSAPVPAPVELAAPAPLDHDPDTGEIGPRILLPLKTATGTFNWIRWGQDFIAGIQSARSVAELDEWSSLNTDRLVEMNKAAPRAYGSVVKALVVMAEKLAPPTTDSAGIPRLPPKESQQLRRALVKKLAECHTLAQVDEWRATAADGIASLLDEDRAGVLEWAQTRKEQLEEVAEVV